jgi:hypothetical protein
VVPRSVVVPPMGGLALVAVVFSSVPGSMPFGCFGFAFFCGEFGAEPGVFFVFDRAAGFFGLDFFFAFAFFACFGFFVFFGGRGGEGTWEGGQAQRLCRGGGGEQREQQQDQQEGKDLAHRPFIGRAAERL